MSEVELKLIRIHCPHCGFEWLAKFGDGAKIITCPSDDGGCDLRFGIEITYTPIVTVFKLEPVTTDMQG